MALLSKTVTSPSTITGTLRIGVQGKETRCELVAPARGSTGTGS